MVGRKRRRAETMQTRHGNQLHNFVHDGLVRSPSKMAAQVVDSTSRRSRLYSSLQAEGYFMTRCPRFRALGYNAGR